VNHQVSIIYSTEKFPIEKHCLLSDMDEVIGEKYFDNHNLIVLENSADEIKIVLAKENLSCIDELWKVLPKEKRINAILVEKEEILKFFAGLYNLFDMNHRR
jgi:hypothetical protein